MVTKKFLILLVFFFFTLGGFIYTEFFYQKTPFFQTSNNKASVAPKPFAVLYFEPNPLVTSASESASLSVIAKTNTSVNLIQLEMGFDPTALFNVDIFPGDYFINPQIVLYKIDIKNGRISYALKGDVNPNNSSSVAVILFNTYNYEAQKETAFSFLPKTSMRNDRGEIKLSSLGVASILY